MVSLKGGNFTMLPDLATQKKQNDDIFKSDVTLFKKNKYSVGLTER